MIDKKKINPEIIAALDDLKKPAPTMTAEEVQNAFPKVYAELEAARRDLKYWRALDDEPELWTRLYPELPEKKKEGMIVEGLRKAAVDAADATADLNTLRHQLALHIGLSAWDTDGDSELAASYIDNALTPDNPESALPAVMFPVRLETIYHGDVVKLRIYPDDVALDNGHDTSLTWEEFLAGKDYATASTASYSDERAKEEALKKRWAEMNEQFGAARTAFIVHRWNDAFGGKTEADMAKETADGTRLPFRAGGNENPVVSRVMPDFFICHAYPDDDDPDAPPIVIHGKPIPHPLVVAPAMADLGLSSESGENEEGKSKASYDGSIDGFLAAHHAEDGAAAFFKGDSKWVVDFEAAKSVGMGLEIPLPEPDTSFARILVFGVKTTVDPIDGPTLVGDLLEAHHYTNGLALIPPNTPTNNDAATNTASPYASVDPPADESWVLETESQFSDSDVAAVPQAQPDGMKLADALGVDHGIFAHIAGAGNHLDTVTGDLHSAIFGGTIGYTMESLMGPWNLEVGSKQSHDFKPYKQWQVWNHWTNHVRPAGHFPTLRVGTQPYGVLITSSFSRWAEAADEEGEATSKYMGVIMPAHRLDPDAVKVKKVSRKSRSASRPSALTRGSSLATMQINVPAMASASSSSTTRTAARPGLKRGTTLTSMVVDTSGTAGMSARKVAFAETSKESKVGTASGGYTKAARSNATRPKGSSATSHSFGARAGKRSPAGSLLGNRGLNGTAVYGENYTVNGGSNRIQVKEQTTVLEAAIAAYNKTQKDAGVDKHPIEGAIIQVIEGLLPIWEEALDAGSGGAAALTADRADSLDDDFRHLMRTTPFSRVVYALHYWDEQRVVGEVHDSDQNIGDSMPEWWKDYTRLRPELMQLLSDVGAKEVEPRLAGMYARSRINGDPLEIDDDGDRHIVTAVEEPKPGSVITDGSGKGGVNYLESLANTGKPGGLFVHGTDTPLLATLIADSLKYHEEHWWEPLSKEGAAVVKAAAGALARVSMETLQTSLLAALDAVTFRIDAWITSLFHKRLVAMRAAAEAAEELQEDKKQKAEEEGDGTVVPKEGAVNGLIIGAYGVVENLQPDPDRIGKPARKRGGLSKYLGDKRWAVKKSKASSPKAPAAPGGKAKTSGKAMAAATGRLSRDVKAEAKGKLASAHLGKIKDIEMLPSVAANFANATIDEDALLNYVSAGEGGYIHAPSIAHAQTAAVLRAAALSHTENEDEVRIGLTSGRVSGAQWLVQGLRAGQSPANLLGARFESLLRNAWEEAEEGDEQDALRLAVLLVRPMRELYPGEGTDDVPLESAAPPADAKVLNGMELLSDYLTEDRDLPNSAWDFMNLSKPNVVPGVLGWANRKVLLADAVKGGALGGATLGNDDLSALDDLNDIQKHALRAAVLDVLGDLAEAVDTVSDMTLTEAVHQTLQGKNSRAAALHRFSKWEGGPPDRWESLETPREVIDITHRLFVMLPVGGKHPDTGWSTITPRARANPELNSWIAQLLGPATNIVAWVTWTNPLAEDIGNGDDLPDFNSSVLNRGRPLAKDGALIQNSYLRTRGSIRRKTRAPLIRPVWSKDGSKVVYAGSRRYRSLSPAAPNLSMYTGKTDIKLLPAVPMRPRSESPERPHIHGPIPVPVSELGLSAIDFVIAAHAGLETSGLAMRFKEVVLRADSKDGTKIGNALAQVISGGGAAPDVEHAVLHVRAHTAPNGDSPARPVPGSMSLHRAFAVAKDVVGSIARMSPLRPALLRPSSAPGTYSAMEADYVSRKARVGTVVNDLRSMMDALDSALVGLRAKNPSEANIGKAGAALEAAASWGIPDAYPSLRDDVNKLRERIIAAKAAAQARATCTEVKDALKERPADAGPMKESEMIRTPVLDAAFEKLLSCTLPILPVFSPAAHNMKLPKLSPSEEEPDYEGRGKDGLLVFNDDAVSEWLSTAGQTRDQLQSFEDMMMKWQSRVNAAGGGVWDPWGWSVAQIPSMTTDGKGVARWAGLDFDPMHPHGAPAAGTVSFVACSPMIGSEVDISSIAESTKWCGMVVDNWVEFIPAPTQVTGVAFEQDRPNSQAPQAVLVMVPPARNGRWTLDDIEGCITDTLEMAKIRAVDHTALDDGAVHALFPAAFHERPARKKGNHVFQALQDKLITKSPSSYKDLMSDKPQEALAAVQQGVGVQARTVDSAKVQAAVQAALGSGVDDDSAGRDRKSSKTPGAGKGAVSTNRTAAAPGGLKFASRAGDGAQGKVGSAKSAGKPGVIYMPKSSSSYMTAKKK